MSSFAWLDYSEHDRRAALDVIDKFREHETRDELGLAGIRDGFADLFFPGTGTLQTRARYFFFVPWMYLELERLRIRSAQVAARARRGEIALIDVLADSADAQGTIGVLARARLKRLASSIYWQGLGRLGFRVFPGSQDQYHRSLDRFHGDGSSAGPRADDGEPLGGRRTRNWRAGLPGPPEGFPEEATLTLTAEEAAFLRERITLAAPASLFRYLVDRDEDVSDIDFAWEHPDLAEFPPHLVEQLEHARNLSEVMHGAAVLYNLMLAQKRDDGQLTNGYLEWLDAWRQLMDERAIAHRAWPRARFWELVRSSGANVSARTRQFVDSWIDLALSPEERQLATSPRARALITERELQLKRGQARLRGGRPLDLWQGASGLGRLNFRWYSAQRILRDLHEAESEELVDA